MTFKPGDRVKIIRQGPLYGLEGFVRSIYNEAISVAIPLSESNLYVQSTFYPLPDGSFPTMCLPEELEKMGNIIIH